MPASWFLRNRVGGIFYRPGSNKKIAETRADPAGRPDGDRVFRRGQLAGAVQGTILGGANAHAIEGSPDKIETDGEESHANLVNVRSCCFRNGHLDR